MIIIVKFAQNCLKNSPYYLYIYTRIYIRKTPIFRAPIGNGGNLKKIKVQNGCLSLRVVYCVKFCEMIFIKYSAGRLLEIFPINIVIIKL